jgi:uracil-DNA glycosylase family protein
VAERSGSPSSRKPGPAKPPKTGPPVSDILPDRLSLSSAREAAASCRACDLYARATQTVFGEGPRRAEIMMVGEQPGDVEDVEGHPFVGPAGRLLDRALEQASIDRRLVYLTNVVKHFKWEPRGKRRIHAKPNTAEVSACRPWLDAEVALVKPRILVCLGVVAAQALLGRSFKVSADRGRFVVSTLAPLVTATVHPSSILRARDDDSRREAMERFVADLRFVAAEMARPPRDRARSR